MKYLIRMVAIAGGLALLPGFLRAVPVSDWRPGISGIVGDAETRVRLSEPYPFDVSSALVQAFPFVLRYISEGSRSVTLTSYQADGPLEFIGPDGKEYFWMHSYYTLSVTRDLHLTAGQRVSGLGQFTSYDWVGYGDFAAVSVNGHNIWRFDLDDLGNPPGGDPNKPDEPKVGPRQRWSFTAPADGTYSLTLSIYGDDQLDSWVTFSGIHVPDRGETLLLLGVGAIAVLAFAGFRRRNKNRGPDPR